MRRGAKHGAVTGRVCGLCDFLKTSGVTADAFTFGNGEGARGV
jgi:hypothetical protein